MAASNSLRVLVLEDSEADAELMLYELRKAGVSVLSERVEDAQGFVGALARKPDVILADYNLPQFSGMDALAILKSRRLDIPFILVSGRIGEEIAVAALKEGAADYLLKDRLTRLAPAVFHAIEEGKLRYAKQRAEAALRQLSGRLMNAQDEERRRIARELHDSTAQKLSALTLNLGRLEHTLAPQTGQAQALLGETEALAQEALRELRDISYLLHPPLLDEAGLDLALRWFIDGFSKRSGIDVTLHSPCPIGRLPQEMEITVFRVVQESMTNIHRHSGSRTASVRVEADAESLLLEVLDHGRGFTNIDSHMPPVPGVGLPGIRERVRQLDGEFDLESNENGTRLKVVLPMREDAGESD